MRGQRNAEPDGVKVWSKGASQHRDDVAIYRTRRPGGGDRFDIYRNGRLDEGGFWTLGPAIAAAEGDE